MFIIPIIYTILNQNPKQIPDSKRAKERKNLSRASSAFLSWALWRSFYHVHIYKSKLNALHKKMALSEEPYFTIDS
jgi:hypothetical protein